MPGTESPANVVSAQNVAFAGIMYQTVLVHEGLTPRFTTYVEPETLA
jgi:hypothetical protein